MFAAYTTEEQSVLKEPIGGSVPSSFPTVKVEEDEVEEGEICSENEYSQNDCKFEEYSDEDDARRKRAESSSYKDDARKKHEKSKKKKREIEKQMLAKESVKVSSSQNFAKAISYKIYSLQSKSDNTVSNCYSGTINHCISRYSLCQISYTL
ncbi:hypothetical protein AB6A40_011546 [Gnathostoma spinigerum]|uniref:Uncharacterized protein n=1 Tax=Gnathostoma spinigerum TaxID=75299 RepID=A0ABD6F044_9BILA